MYFPDSCYLNTLGGRVKNPVCRDSDIHQFNVDCTGEHFFGDAYYELHLYRYGHQNVESIEKP
jgi:hypothetical protein